MSETETLRRIDEAVHGYDATECMADHQRRLSDVVAALADVPSQAEYAKRTRYLEARIEQLSLLGGHIHINDRGEWKTVQSWAETVIRGD
jgi:hypothetical protein